MRKLAKPSVLLIITAAVLTLNTAPAAPTSAAVVPLGQQGCPSGQMVSTQNLVQDGSFAEAFEGAIRFETDLPPIERNTYPSDPLGGFSIQRGDVSYEHELIVGRSFPGDTSRDVPPSETFFYSNPSIRQDGSSFFVTGEGLLWRQTVTILPNRTYNFFAYFDNLLNPEKSAGNDPVIELRVDDDVTDDQPAMRAGEPIKVEKTPDQWVPIQYAFISGPSQTTATLEIWDVTGKYVDNPIYGDDFGMVGINLRQCAAALGIAKDVQIPTRINENAYDITYTLTVRNYSQGTEPITNLQVFDDLDQTFAGASGFELRAISGSESLTLDPAYTGRAPNTSMLAAGNYLAADTEVTITFTVRVALGSGPVGRGPFRNLATVTAEDDGVIITDISVPGTNPDPSDSENPKRDDNNQPTDVIIEASNIVLLPLVAR